MIQTWKGHSSSKIVLSSKLSNVASAFTTHAHIFAIFPNLQKKLQGLWHDFQTSKRAKDNRGREEDYWPYWSVPGEPVPSLEALWHVAEKEQEFGGLSKNSDLRDYNLLEQWSNKKVIMTGSFLIFSRLIINAYLSASHLNHKLSELCKTPAPFFCHRSTSNSPN